MICVRFLLPGRREHYVAITIILALSSCWDAVWGAPQAPLFNKELRNSQAAKSHAYPQMMQIKFFNSYNS